MLFMRKKTKQKIVGLEKIQAPLKLSFRTFTQTWNTLKYIILTRQKVISRFWIWLVLMIEIDHTEVFLLFPIC